MDAAVSGLLTLLEPLMIVFLRVIVGPSVSARRPRSSCGWQLPFSLRAGFALRDAAGSPAGFARW
jgi:hypothetical protein